MFKKFFNQDFTNHYCNNGALIGGCYYPIEFFEDVVEDVIGEGGETEAGEGGEGAEAGAMEQGGAVAAGEVTPSSTSGASSAPATGGKQSLMGKSVKIIADRPAYSAYKDKNLVITKVATSKDDHWAYDEAMSGQALVDLEVAETREAVPFSLYEHEFTVV